MSTQNGSREIKFSQDQRGFRVGNAKTPAEAVLGTIPSPEDVRDFLSEIHTDLQYDETYRLLNRIRLEIDETYTRGERFGEAFLDGGAIELDIINRFAPYLKDGLHLSIQAHINRVNIADFLADGSDRFVTTDRQRQYTDDIIRARHRATEPKLADAELALVTMVSAGQYGNGAQYDALLEGFNFVRNHALRANEEDFRLLSRQAFTGLNRASNEEFDQELRYLISLEGKD